MSEAQRIHLRNGLGCPVCIPPRPSSDWERRLARRSIAEGLEEISETFIALSLKCTKGIGKKEELAPGIELYQLLQEFFVACQRGGANQILLSEGIHHAGGVDWINEVIRADVTQILQIAQHTSKMSGLIIVLAETKLVIMEILRSFTSPNIYRDFQWFGSKKEPTDPAPL